ncbi:MAG: tRNA (adenosine(37)-N6)-threonylcarbamoyltransferase complex transferase subunit TsaD [Erysipelotrichaceae bacterium]
MAKIFAIESSCDETACAIINDKLEIESSVVTSQIDVHSRFGGVIPEVASRMHIEQISVMVKEGLSNQKVEDMDAIAYTIGPGLIGSLHIGAAAAKTLAFFYNKPLIGVHHLRGHIFVNELIEPLTYPLLALVVSGGHTELVYMRDEDSFEILGTTQDDAIGEAYDKVARILNLEYPGGPKIDKLSKMGKPHYQLPTPKVDGYNFSFSGLKNACLQLEQRLKRNGEELIGEDLAYAFQEVALHHLLDKTLKVMNDYEVKHVLIAGGVACNSRLRELMSENIKDAKLTLPPLKYCTDNATMIGVAAFKEFNRQRFVPLDASSMPSMPIDK